MKCWFFGHTPMWPINGKYVCSHCLRDVEVPWSNYVAKECEDGDVPDRVGWFGRLFGRPVAVPQVAGVAPRRAA